MNKLKELKNNETVHIIIQSRCFRKVSKKLYNKRQIEKEIKKKVLDDVKSSIYKEFIDADISTKLIINKVATIIQREYFK